MRTNKEHILLEICFTAALIAIAGCRTCVDMTTQNISESNTNAEAKILRVLEDMSKDENWAMWNITPEEGRLLYILTATADAKHVVEIG